jgi:hypothetical protein
VTLEIANSLQNDRLLCSGWGSAASNVLIRRALRTTLCGCKAQSGMEVLECPWTRPSFLARAEYAALAIAVLVREETQVTESSISAAYGRDLGAGHWNFYNGLLEAGLRRLITAAALDVIAARSSRTCTSDQMHLTPYGHHTWRTLGTLSIGIIGS